MVVDLLSCYAVYTYTHMVECVHLTQYTMRHTKAFRLYYRYVFVSLLCISLCQCVGSECIYMDMCMCMPLYASTYLFLLPSNPYICMNFFSPYRLIEFVGVDVDGSSFSPSFPDGSRFFNQCCWQQALVSFS